MTFVSRIVYVYTVYGWLYETFPTGHKVEPVVHRIC